MSERRCGRHSLGTCVRTMRGIAHPSQQVRHAMALVDEGLSDYEVGRSGIPRSTVRNWRVGNVPRVPGENGPVCESCGALRHDFGQFAADSYAYLLGQYLGDGTICRVGTSLCLRIASDAQYEGIIAECCEAIAAIRGRRPNVRYHSDKRLATIAAYWRAWACLFPQHGRGRKHRRTIALATWQVDRRGLAGPVPPRAHPFRRLAWRQPRACERPDLRVSALPVLEPVRRHPAALYLRLRPCRRRLAPLGQVPHLRRAPGRRASAR